MKTISLQEAYNILEECSAVITEDYGLCYPSLWDLIGEDDNEWLFCQWDDEKGYVYSLVFNEDCGEIKFDGTNLYLTDAEDDEVKLTLLVPMNKLAEVSI